MYIFILPFTEETCSRKNPLEKRHEEINKEFQERYEDFGEKLQNEEKCHKHCIYFPMELPEYMEDEERYVEEENKITLYKEKCKNTAFEQFAKYLYDFWM